MIISHHHRYLFVELPRTGSTAVSHELRTHYGGQPILYKHATYDEFLRIATEDEKRYFVFSTIRNPLDQSVSRYHKIKSDHRGQFSDPERQRRKRLPNRLVDNSLFRFLRTTNADFATYLQRFQLFPYDTWASLSHRRFDYVMRFETLGHDFEKVLHLLGIEPVRPLPVSNVTASRDRDFESYYPPRLRGRARRVYGPYMERWGYRFPDSWGIAGPTTLDRATYVIFSFAYRLYWRYLRPMLGDSGGPGHARDNSSAA